MRACAREASSVVSTRVRASASHAASCSAGRACAPATASAMRALPSALSQACTQRSGSSCSAASASAWSARRRSAAGAPGVAALPPPSAQSRQHTASSAPGGSRPHRVAAIRSAGDAGVLAGLSALTDGVGMTVSRQRRCVNLDIPHGEHTASRALNGNDHRNPAARSGPFRNRCAFPLLPPDPPSGRPAARGSYRLLPRVPASRARADRLRWCR